MLCILSFLSAEDITSKQLWHTILGAVYIKYFYLLYRQLCLTWYSHVNFTCQIHVENHLTRNSRGRFTWNSREAQLAVNIQYIIGFQWFFFQECVFSSVIDYRYAVYRVWMRIYLIIWQYLTKLVYLIVMIQMLDVFTL